MTEIEASKLAEQLIKSYSNRAFEISMPDEPSYEFMRSAFAKTGSRYWPGWGILRR